MAESVIIADGLSKAYGNTQALRGLHLQVRQGEVFGFLGPNGSGKTTTIRILLDLIRPSSGAVSVLGLDPRRDGVQLRRRLGYLEGDFTVDGRQSARELISYLAHLRGGVPERRILELSERLRLDLHRKIKTLSRGNRQKVGLVQAFMHEPELLILDEPTSGLDPFLQREFSAMASEVAAEGRTVFMCSHVMSEVQRTSDRVAMIRDGALVSVDDVESLRASAIRHVEIHFDRPVAPEGFATLPGVSQVSVSGSVLQCRLDGPADALVKAVATHPVLSITSVEPSLEDAFLGLYADGDSDPEADA